MRIFLYLVMTLCFCVSCTDSQIDGVNKVLGDVEKPVSQDQKAIINELKPMLLHASKHMQTFSRSNDNVVYQSEEEFDEIDFSALPYCELNEDEFYANPAPENLMNCIRPAKGRYFFLGKKKGNVVMALETVNKESKWHKGFSVEGTKYFAENFSWVYDRLVNSDKKSIYFLTFLDRVYVGCTLEGEPYFFNFIGNVCLDKKGFVSAMFDAKNLKDSYDEYFKKMSKDPERMKQIEKNRKMTQEDIRQERQKWEKERESKKGE